MPLPRCWTISSSNSPIPPPPFHSTNYPQFPNFRRPHFRHHRHQIFGKEEVTEIVYFRLIWVCAILSAFTILCAAIFCFQLLRLPAEIDFKMKRSLANCETFISRLQSNIIQIHTRIHHLGRKRRKVPSSTSQNRTSSSQNVVPLLDAEGKFCCIPGAPGTNGKNGVPGRSGEPGKIGKPGNPGKINPNDAILVAAFGMCGRQIKMEENIGKRMGNCVQSSLKGEPGQIGPRGLKGDKGLRGDPGEPGRNGLIGQCGPKGAKGSRGAPGMPGDKGDQISKPERGDPGPIGPPGDAGQMGSPGLRGATRIGQKGQKGAKGQTRPGPPGLQGIEGIRGPNGLPGLCPRNCELPKEMANRQIAGVVIGSGEIVDGEERQKLVDQEERELAEYEGGMHDELWTTRVEKEVNGGEMEGTKIDEKIHSSGDVEEE